MDKKKQVIKLLEKYGNETDMFKSFITQDEFADLAEEIVKLFAIPDVVGRIELFKCPTCCDTKVKDNGDYCADCEEPPKDI